MRGHWLQSACGCALDEQILLVATALFLLLFLPPMPNSSLDLHQSSCTSGNESSFPCYFTRRSTPLVLSFVSVFLGLCTWVNWLLDCGAREAGRSQLKVVVSA
ncbi:unnamed protein product, partial [Musa acuminata subsp. burmannicoides]